MGDVLERVASQDKLILLRSGDGSINTLGHSDSADNLLANEVSDLDLPQTRLGVLLKVDVDGKMGVDVAHLVLETLGDTNDHVVDDGADGAQSGDVLTLAMVNLNGNNALLGLTKVDGDVAEVLDELASGSLDGDNSRLDRDLDY